MLVDWSGHRLKKCVNFSLQSAPVRTFVNNCIPVIDVGSLKNSPLHSRLVTPLPIRCGSVCCTIDVLQPSCRGLHETTFIVIPRSRAPSGSAHNSRLYRCVLVDQFAETAIVLLTENISVVTRLHDDV